MSICAARLVRAGRACEWRRRLGILPALVVLFAVFLPQKAEAQTSVDLGSAVDFAVLASTGITNTGNTTITGNVGSFPLPAITGFETVILNGTNQGNNAISQQARTDLFVAYADAVARTPDTIFAPVFDLGGSTLTPGVYNDPTSFGLTGTLTLDALGDPNAVWIFQAGSTLTTMANSSIVLAGGAQACHVFWQVGSSATLGAGTDFVGNILAFTSISLGAGATVDGRLLALNGSVTLDSNSIILALCEVIVDGDEVIVAPTTVAALILDECSHLELLSTLTVTSGNFTVIDGQALISGGSVVLPGNLTVNGPGTLVTDSQLQVGGVATVVQGSGLFVNGSLQAPQTNVQSGAVLGGTGVILGNVTNAGMLASGNAAGCVVDAGGEIGTLSILGNYTQTPTGIFALEIGSLLSFDRLLVSGNAFLSGILNVLPLAFDLEFGQQFQFLQADSFSGAFDSINLPDGFRGRIIEEDGFLTLVIAPESYTQAAQNPNQQQAAQAVDSFIPATSGDQATVSAALDMLTAEEFPAAFDAIGPAFYQNVGLIAIEHVNAQNQFLSQRLNAVRLGGRGFQSEGIQSPLIHDRDGKSVMEAKDGKHFVDAKSTQQEDILAPGVDNRWGVWVQGNGIFGKITNVNQVPNANFQGGGVLVGVDYQWADHFTTGIFTGYQGLYSETGNGGLIASNTALFGTYTSYQNGGFYSDAILMGGYSGYNLRRPIEFGSIDRTARSSPGGGQFSAYLDMGYDWTVGNFTFGPIISGQYIFAGIAPFTETGADSLDLSVDQQNINSLRTSVGGRVAYTWTLNRHITLIPEVRMLWQHEFLNDSRNINSSLDGGDGPGFGYQTTAPGRDSVFAGAGVSAQIGKDWNTFLYYNADFGRQDYIAHMVSAGVGWRF